MAALKKYLQSLVILFCGICCLLWAASMFLPHAHALAPQKGTSGGSLLATASPALSPTPSPSASPSPTPSPTPPGGIPNQGGPSANSGSGGVGGDVVVPLLMGGLGVIFIITGIILYVYYSRQV